MRKTISTFDSYYDQMIEVVQNLQEFYKGFETLEKKTNTSIECYGSFGRVFHSAS